MNIEIVGVLAGLLTTFCYVPQILKIMKTKQTQDISLPSFIVLATGIVLWLIYACLKDSVSLILANTSALLFVLLIIFLKLKNEGVK